MKEFIDLYIRTFAFFIEDSSYFINPQLTSEHINEYFFKDHEEVRWKPIMKLFWWFRYYNDHVKEVIKKNKTLYGRNWSVIKIT